MPEEVETKTIQVECSTLSSMDSKTFKAEILKEKYLTQIETLVNSLKSENNYLEVISDI